MDEEEYPLLNTPNLVALILRAAEAGGATAERCADRLTGLFRRTGEQPPLGRDRLVARLAIRIRYLREARLLAAGEGDWRLTARGREALAAHPQGMDLADLAGFPEFAAWLEAGETDGEAALDPRPASYDEGFDARHAGAAFTDNPYAFGSADHQSWENGWCGALDEEVGPNGSPLTGTRRDSG